MIIENNIFKLESAKEMLYIGNSMPFLLIPSEEGTGLNAYGSGFSPYVYSQIPSVVYKDSVYDGISATRTKTVTIDEYLLEFGLAYDVLQNKLTNNDVVFSSISEGNYLLSRQVPFINMKDEATSLYIESINGTYNLKTLTFRGYLRYRSKKSSV